MRRTLMLMALVGLAATSAAAAPRLGEAEVRAFVARQSRAWNAGELSAYFALFTPDARFTDQGRARGGEVVPYGTSTLAEARRQARRSLAGTKTTEATEIRAIRIAPDGRSAVVASGELTTQTAKGRTRRVCADRTQTVVLTSAGLRSRGQTDTVFDCAHPSPPAP